MGKINIKYISIIASIILILICITSVNASEEINGTSDEILKNTPSDAYQDISSDLESKIHNANNGDVILIKKGTYYLHNINMTKSITLQGQGDPREVIIDGEKKSSIFLIRSPNVHVTFKNITFINGQTDDFGGAISIKTGGSTVDNCIFINNTALKNTNAGGISNYGTKNNRGYLYITNSLFVNNHADHDGGAITTCYADSYIYNCVFINNSAHRDGGAIRVSLYGYGDAQDCIFMFNHADEWGGAYYSWSGESNIERCIFMNNTAGTNGGAVMVSGNINIQDSIIANNNGGETGGSFYIQQPMYDAKTKINVNNNLITNNSSPYGKEIFINWKDSYNLYTDFNNNDWGDEDPNDSSVIDPDNITSRSKVSTTKKSNLFSRLNLDLLDKYNDLLGDFFTNDTLENLKNQFKKDDNNSTQNQNPTSNNQNKKKSPKNLIDKGSETNSAEENTNGNSNAPTIKMENSNTQNILGNSTSHGEDKKAYELNETGRSVAKQANLNIAYVIAGIVIVFILLAIGYKRNKRFE